MHIVTLTELMNWCSYRPEVEQAPQNCNLILKLTFSCSCASLVVILTALVSISGDMNNGIKKEALGKDVTRIWINDDKKLHNFSQPLVRIIFGLERYKVLSAAK